MNDLTSGVDTGADNARWHYFRQMVHERVVEDADYLQRSLQNVIDVTDRDLAKRGLVRDPAAGGLNGRHIEILILSRCLDRE